MNVRSIVLAGLITTGTALSMVSVIGAAPAVHASAAPTAALEERLDRAAEVERHDVDAVNTRVSDLNGRIADLGIILGLGAGVIGVIAIVATVMGYFSVSRRVNEAAHEWMKEHTEELERKYATLMDAAQDRVDAAAAKAEASSKQVEEVVVTARRQLDAGFGAQQLPVAERAALEIAAEQTKAKPEREFTVDDWASRALASYADGKLDIAAAYFENAAASAGTPADVASYMHWRGHVLVELRRYDKAIAVFDELVRRFDGSADSAVREEIAKSLFDKASALERLGRPLDAISAYEALIARFGKEEAPEFGRYVAKAFLGIGSARGQIGQLKEALSAYDQVVRRFRDATDPGLREQVAAAFFRQGAALDELDPADAIKAYDEVINLFQDASEPAIRVEVAKALSNKASVLRHVERENEAAAVYKGLVERFSGSDDAQLREIVSRARRRLGELEKQGIGV